MHFFCLVICPTLKNILQLKISNYFEFVNFAVKSQEFDFTE